MSAIFARIIAPDTAGPADVGWADELVVPHGHTKVHVLGGSTLASTTLTAQVSVDGGASWMTISVDQQQRYWGDGITAVTWSGLQPLSFEVPPIGQSGQQVRFRLVSSAEQSQGAVWRGATTR